MRQTTAGVLERFDLTIELSGSAAGLNLAIGATGFEGRVVVGSWYGDKSVPWIWERIFIAGGCNSASSVAR